MNQLECGQRSLSLAKTQIMGILNVTPDSFSDGGSLYQQHKLSLDKALQRAEAMVNAGAAIIDIGGESTRPGAEPVSLQQEMDRVLPVVEKLAASLDVIISVDTSQPEVIKATAKAGAGLINDIRALQQDGALAAVAATGLPVCLMHMQGTSPKNMQAKIHYEDVVQEVQHFFQQRIAACKIAGITTNKLMLDPGFGFGKSLEHNLRLLNNIAKFKTQGLPLLIGTSRKSMIGQVLNLSVDQRLYGSLATVAIAVMQKVAIVRVHDVAPTQQVISMINAVQAETVENKK